MKTHYYVPSRLLKQKLPFWLLPTVLFTVLVVSLLWTFVISHKMDRSYSLFENIQNSIENPNMNSRYSLAMDHFKNGSYYSAIQNFKYIYFSKHAPSALKIRSGIFYAFSLLLEGTKSNNTRLVQESRDIFLELIGTVPKNSGYYSRILLGYTKATRYTSLPYLVGVDAALRQLANMSLSEGLKRQIYLELGYYYFFLNNYSESNVYFMRAGLYIDSPNFYESLLVKEDTDAFIISLLKNNLVPTQVISNYGNQIKQKLLKSGMRFINSGNHLYAKNILMTMINLFPLDSSSEDTYFLMGYIAQKEQNYNLALQYYNKVITNGFVDKDPIALFQMALIYYRFNNVQNAIYYFNILVQKFPYSEYAYEAQKWLEYFYPKQKEVPMPTVPPINLDESSSNYIFNKTPNNHYVVPPIKPKKHIKPPIEHVPNPPVSNPSIPPINVNIDQSRHLIANENSNNSSTRSNRTNTSTDRSGNNTLRQNKNDVNNMNTTSSNNTNSQSRSSRDLMADFRHIEEVDKRLKVSESDKIQEEEQSPQLIKVPNTNLQDENIEEAPLEPVGDNIFEEEDSLVSDFQELDNSLVQTPKFKPLF